MKRRAAPVFLVTLLASAFVSEARSTLGRTRPAADCSRTSVGFVPLVDLDEGNYHGFLGGLYPNVENFPPREHWQLARAAAAAVQPLASDGSPAPAGKVVLLSIGMSNATQEFSTAVELLRGDPELSPALAVVDGAQGGQTASIIKDPNANFWRVVDQRLAAAGVTAAQVQAVWLKEANANPREPFPDHARILTDDLTAIVGVLAGRFANLKLTYLSSRIYAGYATTTLNPEPYAYESGFSVRWLIERQISGEPALNADPKRGPVTAPVLLWGPYLWADGPAAPIGRSDGLVWRCEDFANDGTHPSDLGRRKVADMLITFFKNADTTRSWFLADPDAPTLTPSPTRTPGPGETATITPVPGGTTPPPTQPSGMLRSYLVREAPSAVALWVSTTVQRVHDRMGQVTAANPAWLCGRIVATSVAPHGFRFAESPMDLQRTVDAAWQTTIAAIAADPGAAAAVTHPVCIHIDAVLDQTDGAPPTPTVAVSPSELPSQPSMTPAPSATHPPEHGPRLTLPFASRP